MFEPIGNIALDKVLARIAAEFGEAAKIQTFKRSVRAALARGAGHETNRARYGKRAKMLRDCNIDDACSLVAHWLFVEKHKARIAPEQANPIAIQVCREIALMLRLIRRSRWREHVSGIAGFVEAAE